MGALQGRPFTGQAECASHGIDWLEPVHPDDRARVMATWAEAIERGEFHAEYRIYHADEHRYRWFQTRATAARDEAGHIIEWLGTSTDVDEIRELHERQSILARELQHRTRNLLGVVRSIADRTGESSQDLNEFRAGFDDRLGALARVQGLLSRLGDTDRISFDELIQTEIKAMNGVSERVTLEGPAGIRLRSSTVQTLAMVLHELATNAVKYGALGQPQAKLSIRWWTTPPDLRGRPWLHIDWRESGVHMPHAGVAQQGTGQGRQLIEEALPYQLGGKSHFELGRDGVHCTLSIPVSATNIG
ncbi:PAS domain-containing protein [Aquincola tertiaricarbonis]|uniref:histidine kinase n=1 Tax=Aquincola tertiaricarbonis TaxID=391953 RepID=A0ABY4S4I9_AQUTE|nr:HWE histidine kinase domain-containing protein [Aquincola tertiaricarbonis]URI07903.1 PAS domain-containing protein [Aquincola tertiaricarbonis]